jgi:deazaflavin-dependent oxidoreductase (nitroreductase family)
VSGRGTTSEDRELAVPGRWEGERECHLTTVGRRTGRPHEVEVWFVVHEGRLYVLSGRGEQADYVKNLGADPDVRVRVAGDEREATARVLQDGGAHPARRAWEAKYPGWGAADGTLIEVALAGGPGHG